MKAFINSLRNKFLFIIVPLGIFIFISNHDINAGIYFLTLNYNTLYFQENELIDTKIDKTNMDTIDEIEKHMILVHDVEINTSPDKIWDFLINIDKNYEVWHPADHIFFQWTNGKPFETGSTFYAEQYMMGNKVKYNGIISECIPGKKITMKFSFPISLITEKIEMIIKNHGTHSIFKHVTYMKFKLLSRTVFKKQNIKMLNDMDSHIKTEGGNMKRILENEGLSRTWDTQTRNRIKKDETQKTNGFEVNYIENGIIKFTTHTKLLNIMPNQVYDFLINLNQERFVQFHPKDHKEYKIFYRPDKEIVGTVIYLKEKYENEYVSSVKAKFIEAKLNKKIVLKSISPWWQPCTLVFNLEAIKNGTLIIHHMIIGSDLPIMGFIYNKILKAFFLSKDNLGAIYKHVKEEYENLEKILQNKS